MAAPGVAFGLPTPDTVALGTDYFETTPGTFADLPGIGMVDLKGDPFGPGMTDTIVERQSDATINGPSVPLQITGLQLQSVAPVTVRSYSGAIFISLDPSKLADDTGTMTISGSLLGGTFNTSLDVYFDICTAPGTAGVGCGSGMSLGTSELD